MGVTLAAGVFLMIIGAIIWKLKLVGLFVPKQTDKETDRAGLAKWIGTNLIIIGIVVSVVAVIQWRLFQTTYMLVDFIVIIILSTRMAVGTAKFHRLKGSSQKGRNRVKK